MENTPTAGFYSSISQRATASYRRLLVDPTCLAGEIRGPQADLHAFFKSLYDRLYEKPDEFGLPLGKDICITEDEPNAKDKKQEVKRRLDKPKAMIGVGLNFLMQAGIKGSLDGEALVLTGYAAAVKLTKVSKKFLGGLELLGLTLADTNDTVRLHHARFPKMMAALQSLARACESFDSIPMGKFRFIRCDFRALHKADPKFDELYRAFVGQEYDLVMELHGLFSRKGYKTTVEAHGDSLQWVVKYQGSRQVKATPLFQIDYDDRYARPLRMQIKCASAQRIAKLLPRQSRLLQDDFARRANTCREDECRWCGNNKTLGPTLVEINGEPRTICWYTNGDIHDYNEDTFELVRQYELLHAELGLAA